MLKVAKLDGTKIVNLSVANSLEDGFTDVSAITRVNIGGYIIDGAYVPPAHDDRLVLVGTQWQAPELALLLENETCRKNLEKGGMITSGGTPLSTDEAAQGKMADAVKYLEDASGVLTIDFAVNESTFVELDLVTLKALTIEVGGHVQAAFTKQKNTAADIQNGTITTFDELAAAWV